MRPLESVLLRLEQQGVGVQGTTLFAGTGVDVPNSGTIVTVTETGGQAPQKTHNSGMLRQPSFQIVARSTDYRLASAKADAAWLALANVINMTIGGIYWLWMRPEGEVFTLPVDANGRNRVAFNIETVRR